VLAVRDESSLKKLSVALTCAGVEHILIVEGDAPYEKQATAIGVLPKKRSELKKFFSALPLL
jgi:hypothetical protein